MLTSILFHLQLQDLPSVTLALAPWASFAASMVPVVQENAMQMSMMLIPRIQVSRTDNGPNSKLRGKGNWRDDIRSTSQPSLTLLAYRYQLTYKVVQRNQLVSYNWLNTQITSHSPLWNIVQNRTQHAIMKTERLEVSCQVLRKEI